MQALELRRLHRRQRRPPPTEEDFLTETSTRRRPTRGGGPIVTVTDIIIVPAEPTSTTDGPVSGGETSLTSLTSTSTTSSTSSTTSTSALSPTIATVVAPVQVTPAIIFTSTARVSPTTQVAASSSPPAASSSDTKSSLSTGTVIGGIAGALIGVAAIVVIFMFAIRRFKKHRDDEFNADVFKRQSTVLVDGQESRPRSYGGTVGGTGPRPPSIIEQRLNNANAVSYGHQQRYEQERYGTEAGYGLEGSSNPDYGQNPAALSFTPGQLIPPATFADPGSSVPSFAPQSQSPITSPSVPYYDSQYDQSGNLVQQASINQSNLQAGALLTRNNSLDPSHPSHRVDLNRSSITPYQAAQYAEISRRLNSEPLKPLPPVPEHNNPEEARESFPSMDDFPPVPDSGASARAVYAGHAGVRQHYSPLGVAAGNSVPESPFADPEIQQPPGLLTAAGVAAPTMERQSQVEDQYASFPAPSSLRRSAERVDSTGALPEIQLHEPNPDFVRAYPDDFPVSALGNSFVIPSPTASQTFDGPQPAAAAPTHIKPSPLREATTASTVATPINTSPVLSGVTKGKRVTVYGDEADAYGGI